MIQPRTQFCYALAVGLGQVPFPLRLSVSLPEMDVCSYHTIKWLVPLFRSQPAQLDQLLGCDLGLVTSPSHALVSSYVK